MAANGDDDIKVVFEIITIKDDEPPARPDIEVVMQRIAPWGPGSVSTPVTQRVNIQTQTNTPSPYSEACLRQLDRATRESIRDTTNSSLGNDDPYNCHIHGGPFGSGKEHPFSPRVTGCGHTICLYCLKMLPKPFKCPFCATIHNVEDPTTLPINYQVVPGNAS